MSKHQWQGSVCFHIYVYDEGNVIIYLPHLNLVRYKDRTCCTSLSLGHIHHQDLGYVVVANRHQIIHTSIR